MKNIKYLLLGVLTGLIIYPLVFNWLGIPTFDKLLYKLFGNPDNPLSFILALIFCIGLICLILLPIFRKNAEA
ncbi:hypothetical protein QMK38_08395 [Lysinibacillus fusiformis]|nr:hypothetical protein [Lysinibacillus fusiformis]